jgi:hypothetical protein
MDQECPAAGIARAVGRCVRALCLLLVVCLAFWCVSPRAQAGPLQEVEDRAEGRGEKSERHASSSSSSGRAESSTTQDDASDHAFGRFVMQLLLSPWIVPRMLADDRCFERYAEYPYADAPGWLRPALDRAGCTPELMSPEQVAAQQRARRFSAHVELEGGYVLGNVLTGSVAARAQLPARLSLEGRLSYWEDLLASPREQALGGTAHIAYRFAQGRGVAFRTGLGLRVFTLHTPELGIDFLYGVDVFGKRPILAHLELHAGALHQSFAGQVRLSLGVQIWKLELYAGYDHQVVASRGQRARLSGPLLGVRAWF